MTPFFTRPNDVANHAGLRATVPTARVTVTQYDSTGRLDNVVASIVYRSPAVALRAMLQYLAPDFTPRGARPVVWDVYTRGPTYCGLVRLPTSDYHGFRATSDWERVSCRMCLRKRDTYETSAFEPSRRGL